MNQGERGDGRTGLPALGRRRFLIGSADMMERNLDRWTVIFSILFVANTIALLKV